MDRASTNRGAVRFRGIINMRDTLRITFLAGGAVWALLTAAPAFAEEDKGFYIALSGGVNSVQDTEIRYYDVGGTFSGTGTTDSAQTTADLKSAATFGGALGYDFGRVRADVEVSYARNKLQSLTVSSVNGSAVTLDQSDRDEICDYLEANGCSGSGNTISFTEGGRIRQLSALANIWLDIPLGAAVTPYVGGGVGATGFESDGEGGASFSWQAGAGIAFRLSKQISLTGDYRYRSTSGKNIPYDANSGFETGTIKSSTLAAGLRVTF